LAAADRKKPIAIVESEKTAVITSIHFPGSIWLATGGCSNLRLDEIVRLAAARPVTLYPDGSQFANWSKIARRYAGRGVRVSRLLESRLSSDEKVADLDLADLILRLTPDN
jgi:hypothetical protein